MATDFFLPHFIREVCGGKHIDLGGESARKGEKQEVVEEALSQASI